MNIDPARTEFGSRAAPGQLRSVDMTISQDGVSINEAVTAPVQTPVTPPPAEPLQPVTSTPDLQQLLSPEEIQALQQFRAGGAIASSQQGHAATYDGRGAPVRADGTAPGRFVDLIG